MTTRNSQLRVLVLSVLLASALGKALDDGYDVECDAACAGAAAEPFTATYFEPSVVTDGGVNVISTADIQEEVRSLRP